MQKGEQRTESPVRKDPSEVSTWHHESRVSLGLFIWFPFGLKEGPKLWDAFAFEVIGKNGLAV